VAKRPAKHRLSAEGVRLQGACGIDSQSHSREIDLLRPSRAAAENL